MLDTEWRTVTVRLPMKRTKANGPWCLDVDEFLRTIQPDFEEIESDAATPDSYRNIRLIGDKQ